MTATVAAAAALVVAAPQVAHAAVAATPDDTATVAGGVWALAAAGDRTIVGGKFTRLGARPRLNVGALLPDGKVDPAFVADTNGKVEAVATSSDGSKVFIGGTFTEVNGVPRANLAAVDAVTGQVVDGWTADTAGASPAVLSLAVSGDRLYASGKFASIDGVNRGKLAALDTETGTVQTAFRPRPAGGVREIVVSPDGGAVFAGGGFSSLGGQATPNYAGAVSSATGDALPFAPSQGGGQVVTVGLTPDGSRFFFSTENNNLFAYDWAVSNNPAWVTKTSGNTQAVAASSTEVYMGGHFSGFNEYKIKRPWLASVSLATGKPTTWDTQASGGNMGTWALLIQGDKLHAGGVFSYFGSDPQRGYARFSGTPTP